MSKQFLFAFSLEAKGTGTCFSAPAIKTAVNSEQLLMGVGAGGAPPWVLEKQSEAKHGVQEIYLKEIMLRRDTENQRKQ